jgi:predicted permease
MNLLKRLNTLRCSLRQRPEEGVRFHPGSSGAIFVETMWHDIRFALRTLRYNPGFAAITALTLALGVAGNILIFTVYNSPYLRLFPFVEPSRLVDLDKTAPRWNLKYTGLSYPDFDNCDPVVLQRVAFPRYFETMAIPMVAGRSFTERDGMNDGSRSVIVNENFAKRFWPGENPIGKRISHRYPNAPWMTVVGVAKDVRHYGQDQPVTPGVYIPFVQDPQWQMAVVVRSSVEPFVLVASVRSLVMQSDPELPVFGVVTMEQRLAQSIWPRRLTASLFAIFSSVALLMAVGGIYGVFSYVVSRRTQEIGVRMALGAHGRDVLWLVVRTGLALAGIGVGIGLLGTLLLVPGTRNLLYGVSPFDPIILAGVALLLMDVAAFACWLPARRAMNVQPMTALRCE